MQPSTVSQESAKPIGFVSQLGNFALDASRLNPDGHSTCLSNYLYFDERKKPKAVASLALSSKGAAFSIRRAMHHFNNAIRFHCEKLPLGFASVGGVDSEESNGCGDDSNGVLEESERDSASAVTSDAPKKVLILMSDTGGGHRASAEAIKAAFAEEFGDEYQV